MVNGNLTLGGGPSTFNFKSLYVTGNLTLGGNTNTNSTALYVGGNFNISGPSGTSKFGPIYVGGSVNWGGALSVQTYSVTPTTVNGTVVSSPTLAGMSTSATAATCRWPRSGPTPCSAATRSSPAIAAAAYCSSTNACRIAGD